MGEEIRIIVIKRATLGRDPDPAEIIRLFSPGDPYATASRFPLGPLDFTPPQTERRDQTWRLYAWLSGLSAAVALGLAIFAR